MRYVIELCCELGYSYRLNANTYRVQTIAATMQNAGNTFVTCCYKLILILIMKLCKYASMAQFSLLQHTLFIIPYVNVSFSIKAEVNTLLSKEVNMSNNARTFVYINVSPG